jgi:DNA internalization-related competence protein ComEC/Rec2
MPIFALAFLTGILVLQSFSILPAIWWVYGLVIAVGLLSYIFRKAGVWIKLPLVCVLGFSWCLWYAHAQTKWFIPYDLEGKTVSVVGYVASIPEYSVSGSSFLFSLRKFQSGSFVQSARGLVSLNFRDQTKSWRVGDKWLLTVRLKKPYGTLNPGGFDYEAWALQAGVRANGYIIAKSPMQRLSHHHYRFFIMRIRQYFNEKIAASLPVTQTSPWISALAIGERKDIAAEDWQVLRNTGTNHLMAIAGLHIGLMSALAHFMVAWCWRRSTKLCLRIPAMHAGSIAALIMAIIYSAMAGFSIPTQRASIMLFVFLITVLLRRHIPVWHAWACALIGVLCLNPLSVLSDSFFLSFGSVGLIIYGVSGRLSPKGLWWKWGRIQWVIALGLVPLSLALFHQCSLVSFFANSIAIPWVGFIVVPLTLLGCFCLLFSIKLGGCVLVLADKVLSVLWGILVWFSHLPGVVWYQSIPNTYLLIVSLLAVVFLLIPKGFPGRYLGFLAFLPIILFKPDVPKYGDARLTVLDVGQGLSSVVQTQHHVLVFDTGPRSSSGFDMGDSVVVPFLHSIGAQKVDELVISHGDNDHIGGASAVLRAFPVMSVKSSVPALLPKAHYCIRGESWDWDGVHFAFLHPSADLLNLNNNSSCVLRVSVANQHILLTGDIEKLAERDLTKNLLQELPATIMVAPHHGSKTSAIDSFVYAVHPRYIVFPVGYRNRYHFPHQLVIDKYQKIHALAFETDKTGAIQFQLNMEKAVSKPDLYRIQWRHYWNN